eukprot:CAMPEP_0176443364 /NCGR_PEP_ID=MMETSP0127-20121128/22376_1 /TAXON_ID=938130 /ORGANISM="Platyophrya macrostoma, Strain WH" /LENGTH=470 /DNA_ID=CAMNT_0017828573 /DNA_START=1 /DNA_END=1414 /DNA_ORIENTATION=+
MQVSRNWTKALKTAVEFNLQPLKVLEGKIPQDLNGSLYRNGPGRLERGGEPYGHWFDGDGAVLGIHFRGGKAEGAYKYAKSKEFLEEEAAGKNIYGGIGKKSRRGFFKELLDPNIGAIVKDKLLALCEGGWPYAMDPKTLDSIGPDNLGKLVKMEMYSAHPKVDPDTGDIFNFGQTAVPPHLCVYKSDKSGQIIAQNKVKIRGLNMIHDCVIAGKYLVIFNPPTEIKLWKVILGISTYNDCININPSHGTEMFIFDRNDLSLVSKSVIDPFYAFHFTNGYEEKDGTIHIEFAQDKFEEAWKFTRDFPLGEKGESVKADVGTVLSYMRIDPKQGKVIKRGQVSGTLNAEFPTVADTQVGKKWQYSHFVTSSVRNASLEVGEYYRAIGRLDHKSDKLQIHDFGPNRYVNEPLLVSKKENPEEGYILTLIFDSEKEASELWIHESKNLEGDPICKIGLPEFVPLGFHGKFYSA